MSKRITVTAALPYTNGPIHIGHLAGVYVPADVFVRYNRKKDNDIIYICGSDEHGVPITIKAKNEGISPQQVVDKYHAIIKQSFKDFGISFDNYSRTSAEIHHKTASDFFKKLYEEDKFIEEVSEQFYDEKENQFLADRYITGTCPKCGNEEAYGDQCENCGRSLSPRELINPTSKLSGNHPILKETKHWYLPLNDYQAWLKEWILTEHKNDWKPNVLGQVKSWIDDGLKPRAVTRDLDWGIKVPVKGADGKVLYVWFDAPIGYISATKEWAEQNNANWEDYWKKPDTELYHFIGKDNIVFHCVIFPAMLKAHGEYIIPKNVPANEFLNLEGEKLSTSKNWAIWLHEYLEDFPDQQDVLRYTLLSNLPETKDNNFTWKDFQTKNNSELVGILGNFVNRVVVLTHKYYDGVLPSIGQKTELDLDIIQQVKDSIESCASCIDRFRFRDALGEFIQIARIGNKYLADEEPWKAIKTDPERVKTNLYIAIQISEVLAQLSEVFLPFTAKKLHSILNTKSIEWDAIANFDLIAAGHTINKAELLFSKIEDDVIETQIQKLHQMNVEENSNVTPQKETFTYDEFMKNDLRVGTILEAKKVEKADKLLQFVVDTGIDKRTIVSGVAEYFKPEDLIGKQVTVLVNLAPRKIRGIESQGMLLLAEDENGLTFVTPETKVAEGSSIS